MAEPPSFAVAEVDAPVDGLWRIGRAEAPLASSRVSGEQLGRPGAGHRFDAVDHGTRYFASTLEACFGEILATHRPTPALAHLVADDWQQSRWLAPARLPADWRARRVTVHIAGVADLPARPFLDAEAAATHQVLRLALADQLAELGHRDLDVAAIRGPDRRLTRLVASWAWAQRDRNGQPRYAGLRYLSRLNTPATTSSSAMTTPRRCSPKSSFASRTASCACGCCLASPKLTGSSARGTLPAWRRATCRNERTSIKIIATDCSAAGRRLVAARAESVGWRQ